MTTATQVDDSTEEPEALRALGEAVRARRHQLGLTLATVAERTGLSTPFLSQVETSFAMPSLISLFAIAEALSTSPERLLAGPAPDAVVVTRRGEGSRYAVTDADNPAERHQLTGLGEPFSIAEYVVEPGSDLGGFFSSDGREFIRVIEGRLMIDLEDGPNGEVTTYELAAGDSITYSTSIGHRWRVRGKRVTRFLHVVIAEQALQPVTTNGAEAE